MKRKHWYYTQPVSQQQLNDAFTGVEAAIAQKALNFGVSGIVSGMDVYVPGAGATTTTCKIRAGVAIDKYGRVIVAPETGGSNPALDLGTDTDGTSTAVTEAGRERWVSVFARYGRIRTTPKSDGNTPAKYLYEDQDEGLNSGAGDADGSPSVFDLVHSGTSPESGSASFTVPPATPGEGKYLIVAGDTATTGNAVRPALRQGDANSDSGAVLVADFKRTYNSNVVTVSRVRTEYALRGLTGYVESAWATDGQGTSAPAKYRQIFGYGAVGPGDPLVSSPSNRTRIYVRTQDATYLNVPQPTGGIVITQGCWWNDDTQRWVADSATAPSAGAIVLNPDGSIMLCSRVTTSVASWPDSPAGATNTTGWTKCLEVGYAGSSPDETVHMRMQDGGIAMVQNGANTCQKAIMAAGVSGTGVGGVMGAVTWPQPFSTIPSSVTISSMVSAYPGGGSIADVNVTEVSLVGLSTVGAVLLVASGGPETSISAARTILAHI